MKVVVAGGTGFIGRRLVASLVQNGHECTVVSRRPIDAFLPNVVVVGYVNPLNEVDAVVNLAGEPIPGLWTKSKKRRIVESRIETTRRLVKWMTGLSKPPSVFVSASAVGYYGDRGAEEMTESSGPDPAMSFLAKVCMEWEKEANLAGQAGVRVVNLRLGNVLDPTGGMLGRMLPMVRFAPFILPFASNAYFPWISLHDAVNITSFAMNNASLVGPVNAVGPEPTTYGDFFRGLGERMHRPVLGRMPDWMVRIALGELSNAVLASQRVLPAKLLSLDYPFKDRDLHLLLKGTPKRGTSGGRPPD